MTYYLYTYFVYLKYICIALLNKWLRRLSWTIFGLKFIIQRTIFSFKLLFFPYSNYPKCRFKFFIILIILIMTSHGAGCRATKLYVGQCITMNHIYLCNKSDYFDQIFDGFHIIGNYWRGREFTSGGIDNMSKENCQKEQLSKRMNEFLQYECNVLIFEGGGC